jgi:flagellar biogenesis protein FliO
VRIMLSAILALIATAIAHAGVNVTGLDWKVEGQQGRFTVGLSAPMTSTPDWDVNGGRFAVTIPGAKIEKNIVKNVLGARLAAANTSRGVLATLTLAQGALRENHISLTLKDGVIEVTAQTPATAAVTRAPAIDPKKTALTKSDLGEDFLKKIESEVLAQNEAEAKKQEAAAAASPAMTPTTVAKDEVASTQAAPKRENNFSMVGYAGKFTAFLGVVLLFFWGVVQLMKKGLLSKSKLGFLNNSQLVSVLSTTYVAPKRAILLVKAHNQAFLVSSSESGMSFIAEVKDVPGLVKQTEREITVDGNFDDSVAVASTKEVAGIKEKLDIYQSQAVEEKSSVQKDFVRFSDELKKKVKNLKSLQ